MHQVMTVARDQAGGGRITSLVDELARLSAMHPVEGFPGARVAVCDEASRAQIVITTSRASDVTLLRVVRL